MNTRGPANFRPYRPSRKEGNNRSMTKGRKAYLLKKGGIKNINQDHDKDHIYKMIRNRKNALIIFLEHSPHYQFVNAHKRLELERQLRKYEQRLS